MPQRTALIVCAYLGPLALIPFFAARQDPDAQWHARQGLAMTLVEVAVLGVLSVFVGAMVLTNFGAGIALLSGLWLLWVAVLVVHLTAVLTAINGGRLRVPGTAALADADWQGALSSLAREVRTRVRPR